MSEIKRCSKYKNDKLIDIKFSPFCRHDVERASMLMSDDMTLFVTGDLHFNDVTFDCLCGSVRSLYDYAIERGVLDRISRREFCERMIKWDVDMSVINEKLSIIIFKFIDKDEWNVVCTDVNPAKRYNFGCLTTGTLKDIFDIISTRIEKRRFLYKKIVEYDAMSPVTKFLAASERENGPDVLKELTGKSVREVYEDIIEREEFPEVLSDDVSDFIMFVVRRLYNIWFVKGDYSGENPIYHFESNGIGSFDFDVTVKESCSSFVLDFNGGILGTSERRTYNLNTWRELELKINNLTGIDGCGLMED